MAHIARLYSVRNELSFYLFIYLFYFFYWHVYHWRLILIQLGQ